VTIHTEPLPREKLRDIADQPELLVAMAILVAFVVLASLQVFTRYVLGNQFVWTEELSGNLLIWLTFLGATAIERPAKSRTRVVMIVLSDPAKLGRSLAQDIFRLRAFCFSSGDAAAFDLSADLCAL